MTLNDLKSKPIDKILEEMSLIDMKVHADEYGNIRSIELKYATAQVGTITTDAPFKGFR